jgi:hypothetical protein
MKSKLLELVDLTRIITLFDIPYVYSDEINPLEYIVATNKHTKVCDRNVFETSYDCSRQCRVILRTKDDAGI